MEASEVGVWRLLKNDDNGQSWVIYMFILTKWLTQVGGDEISCNDIMAGLLRTGTLSRIDFHQGVETRSLSPSRPQMPPDIYVYCLIPASTGTGGFLIRSRVSSISIQAGCWGEQRLGHPTSLSRTCYSNASLQRGNKTEVWRDVVLVDIWGSGCLVYWQGQCTNWCWTANCGTHYPDQAR